MHPDLPEPIGDGHRPPDGAESPVDDLRRFHEMFERASIGQLAMEIPGYRITAANQVLCTLMGYSREELIGADGDAMFRHGGPWDRTPTDRLLAGEIDSYVVERDFPCKDGHLVPVVDTVCAVRDRDGSVRQLLVLVQQVSAQRDAEEARRASQVILETAIASSQVMVTTFDRDLRFTFLAGGGITQSDHGASEFLGRDVREVFDDADTRAALEGALEGHQSSTRTAYGDRTYSTVHAPLRSGGAEITGVISVSSDITDEVAAEAAGSRNRALLDTVLMAVPMLVASFDLEGQLIDGAGRLFERSTEAQRVVGKRLDTDPGFSPAAALIDKAVNGEETLTTIEHLGSFYQSFYTPNRNAEGQVVGVLAVVTDVSERHLAEQRALFVASHDALTGLLSRAALIRHLDTELCSRAVSILVVDLDDLQVINDSLGHEVGDGAIGELVRRLLTALPGLTIARTGGDEVTVVVSGPDSMTAAHDAAARVSGALRAVMHIGEHAVTMTASIGMAFAPAGSSSSAVIRDADSALHDAKRSGRGEVRVYTPESRRRIQRRHALEVGLRAALHDEDLRLAYQPVVNLSDRRIVGAEALLRWDDASGPVPPAELIPIAEATGLIVPIGEWVLDRACRDIAYVCRRRHELSVCVNVSARQLMSRDPSAWVDRILATSGLPPEALILEVTESALLDDLTSVRLAFENLRRRGVRIAIDDFGTGYSSLARLQEMPVDVIKLDRAFVIAVADRPEARTMAAAILGLSRAMGASIVAEGIETEEQASTLLELGYEHAQGYLFARPMPLGQLYQLLGVPGHIAPPAA